MNLQILGGFAIQSKKPLFHRILKLLILFVFLILTFTGAAAAHGPERTPPNSVYDLASFNLNELRIWTSRVAGKQLFGGTLSGRLEGSSFRLDYDSTESQNDNGWIAAFKDSIYMQSPPVKGELKPAGRWFGWMEGKWGTSAYGRQWTALATDLIEYERPVSGFHGSFRSGRASLRLFTGAIQQDGTVEVIRLQPGVRQYQLPHENIWPGSENVQIQVHASETDDTIVNVFYPEYELDYVSGRLELDEKYLLGIGDNPAYLTVSYRYTPDNGRGHAVSGAKLTLGGDGLQAQIGYLQDADSRAPKEIVSLGATLGSSEKYVKVETAQPVDGLSSPGVERGAWLGEIGLGTDDFRLKLRRFHYGIGFPVFEQASHKPGEAGWSGELQSTWLGNSLSLGGSIVADSSYSQYPGTLLTRTGHISVRRDLKSIPFSIEVGHSSSVSRAQDNTNYPGQQEIDSWVAVRQQRAPLALSVLYGWGHKKNTELGGQVYPLLRTNTFGFDLYGSPDLPGGFYAAFRRETSLLPGYGQALSRQDSLMFGAGYSEQTVELELNGSIYRMDGYLWDEPEDGSELELSFSYTPLTVLSVNGEVCIEHSRMWEWQGHTGISVQPASDLTTTLQLSRSSLGNAARVEVAWQPGWELSGDFVTLTEIVAAAGRESEMGEVTHRYEARAVIDLASSGGIQVGMTADRQPAGDSTNSYQLEYFRDWNNRYRLAFRWERRLGLDGAQGTISQAIAGVECRYRLAQSVSLSAGYAWGTGFDPDEPGHPTGLWFGLENSF